MNLKRVKSHHMKRSHGDDEFTQPRKFQRLESSGEQTQTMRIVDLNDDCLTTIFGHLELSSLFNVAVANEWLRPAAGIAYKRKFGMTTVNIGGCDDYRRNTRAKIRDNHFTKHNTLNVGYAGIDVRGLKTCLQYLHCFGPFIRNLTICHKKSKSKRYAHIYQYINDWCADSLVQLSLFAMPNIAIEQFQTNFPNVRALTVSCSENGGQLLPSMMKWFPNLLQLRLYQGKMSIDNVLDVIKDNRSISELLVMNQKCDVPVNSAAVERLVSKHPMVTKLELLSYQLMASDAITLIRQLDKLEKLHFLLPRSEYIQMTVHLRESSEWTTSYNDVWYNHQNIRVELKRRIE